MAHEVESMFYAGATPWHGLGVYVGDRNVTSQEAIEAANLDRPVDLRPLYFESSPDSGEFLEVEDRKALVRRDDGAYYATVSNRYAVLQTRDAFAFLDGVGRGKMRYHTAGSLFGGRRVWLLAQLEGAFDVVPGDRVDPFVLFTNSFDGITAARILPTGVRAVCANTVRMAIADGKGTGITIRHTGRALDRMRNAERSLQSAFDQAGSFKEFAGVLARNEFNGAKLTEFVHALFPNGKDEDGKIRKQATTGTLTARSKIVKLFDRGVGQDIPGVRGTAWAALNAVTEYVNYHAPASSQQRRLESVMFDSTVEFDAAAILKKMVA